MKPRDALVAAIPLALLIGHVALYVVSIDRSSRLDDFELILDQPPPIVMSTPAPLTLVADMPSRRLRDDLTVTMPGSPAELTWTNPRTGKLRIDVPPLPTGVHLLEMKASYMGGRDRTAAVPIVVGPFGREDDWIEEGLTLHISQDLLYAGPNSERDITHALVTVLQQELDYVVDKQVPARFAKHLDTVVVESVTLDIEAEGLRASTRGVINDDTVIEASALIEFLPIEQGRAKFGISEVKVKTRIGKSMHDAIDDELERIATTHKFLKFVPFRKTIAKKYGHPKAMKMLRGYFKKTLPDLLESEIVWAMEEYLNYDEPIAIDDTTGVRIRWSGKPVLMAGEAMIVKMDTQVVGEDYPDDLVMPGPPLTGDPSPLPAVTSTAGLGLSTDLINALLFRYWATGTIDEWVAGSAVLDDFNDSNLLRVRVDDPYVSLPPLLSGAGSHATTSLGFMLSDGPSKIAASSSIALDLSATWNVQKVDVGCTVEAFHLYCSEDSTLVTCYPDLLQIARDQRMLEGSVNDLVELDLAGFSDVILYDGPDSELRLRIDHMVLDTACGGICADVSARL